MMIYNFLSQMVLVVPIILNACVVGMVRSRTKATEFSLVIVFYVVCLTRSDLMAFLLFLICGLVQVLLIFQ